MQFLNSGGAAALAAVAPNAQIVRYTAQGQLDRGFAANGQATTNFFRSGIGSGYEEDSAIAVHIQGDGRIVAIGTACRRCDKARFALARYMVNGSLDPSFGSNGTVQTEFGNYAYATAGRIQQDGKIIAVGDAMGIALARYQPNGHLDPTFGVGGKVGRNGPLDVVNAMAIQRDGKILLAGQLSRDHAVVVRYTSRGKLDPSFGKGGSVQVSLFATALALQNDGKIVIAGERAGDFALARLTPDGHLDPSFGTRNHG